MGDRDDGGLVCLAKGTGEAVPLILKQELKQIM